MPAQLALGKVTIKAGVRNDVIRAVPTPVPTEVHRNGS
jgi:hypothetical protein